MVWILLMLPCWAGTLAVLPFDNRTGSDDYDALGLGLADMLVTDLSNASEITLVERTRVTEVLAEVTLGDQGYLDPATAVRAGKGLGAEYMLVGAITAVDPVIRLDARVIDVATGRIAYTASAEGDRAEFFLVEKELALEVLAAMDIVLSPREAARVGRVATESFEALIAYSEGLDALDHEGIEAASRRFESAIRLDSGFRAADEAVAGLREDLRRLDAERDSLLSDAVQEAFARMDAYAAGEAPIEDIVDLAQSLMLTIGTLKQSEQVHVTSRLLELDLGEEVRFQPPNPMSLNEWALAYRVMATRRLMDRHATVTWGKVFLERYPAGTFYGVTKQAVDFHLARIEREQQAESTGEIIRIRADNWDNMLETRCDDEPDVRRQGATCDTWMRWRVEHDRPWKDHEIATLFHQARSINDGAAMERIIDLEESLALDVEKLAGHREDLAKAPQRAQSADEALALLKASTKDERARRMRYWVRDLMRVGRFDDVEWGLGVMRRHHPHDKETYRARWYLAETLGDADRMRTIQAESITAGVPIGSSRSSEATALKTVTKTRWQTGLAMADMYEDLRNDFGSAQLYRLAAESQQAILDEYPDWPRRKPEVVMLEAARRWSQVDDPEALERARALHTQVVERFPGTQQARSSADWLQRAPQ